MMQSEIFFISPRILLTCSGWLVNERPAFGIFFWWRHWRKWTDSPGTKIQKWNQRVLSVFVCVCVCVCVCVVCLCERVLCYFVWVSVFVWERESDCVCVLYVCVRERVCERVFCYFVWVWMCLYERVRVCVLESCVCVCARVYVFVCEYMYVCKKEKKVVTVPRSNPWRNVSSMTLRSLSQLSLSVNFESKL